MRPTAEQKDQAIQMLNRHDTYEVEVMEAIKYGQTSNELLQEAEAEQADPPDTRIITAALKDLVKRMVDDENLDSIEEVPAYLRPEAMTV